MLCGGITGQLEIVTLFGTLWKFSFYFWIGQSLFEFQTYVINIFLIIILINICLCVGPTSALKFWNKKKRIFDLFLYNVRWTNQQWSRLHLPIFCACTIAFHFRKVWTILIFVAHPSFDDDNVFFQCLSYVLNTLNIITIPTFLLYWLLNVAVAEKYKRHYLSEKGGCGQIYKCLLWPCFKSFFFFIPARPFESQKYLYWIETLMDYIFLYFYPTRQYPFHCTWRSV